MRRREQTQDDGELLRSLRDSLLSMQELFERSCEMSCWEIAMELCEVVASSGDVHSDAMNLPEVVSKLWRLIVEQAWKGEDRSDEGCEDEAAAEQAWQRVEASVCGIGRRRGHRLSAAAAAPATAAVGSGCSGPLCACAEALVDSVRWSRAGMLARRRSSRCSSWRPASRTVPLSTSTRGTPHGQRRAARSVSLFL